MEIFDTAKAKRTVEKFNEIRVELDALIQAANSIKRSSEMTLAWRSLQMAKAWVGEAKGTLSGNSPYHAVKLTKDIPEVDAQATTKINFDGLSDLDKVNLMREKIQTQKVEVEQMMTFQKTGVLAGAKLRQALVHLTEARFWYGFELGNMREAALI